MVSDRRRSPDRGGRGGPIRHNRRNENPGGPRMVPYTPKRIKGSPNKRCYVNNLPYDLKWQQFKDHMKEAGNVTFVELFEDEGGKSLGCGLVEYSTPEEAKKAIESLNDSKVNGREIKVKADEVRFYPKVPDPMGPPPPMGGHGHGGPGMPMGPGPMHPMDMGPPPMQQQAVSNVVFVSNLAYEITPKFLRDQFKGAGEILRVNLERDREGKSKGFGTVTFAYPDMALRCIDMFNQQNIKGRRLSVRLDKLTSVSVPGPMGPGHGPMGPGPMGPGPMGPGPMGPGPMGPGPMSHGHGPSPMEQRANPIGSSHMGPGPMSHGSGSMGPSSGPGSHGPPGPTDQPGGYGQQPGGYGSSSSGSDQQSKLLQSIGLAAISSMLGGSNNPMLSSLINSAGAADVRGGSSSALENLLGRDTMEGLLKTQSVGGTAGGGGGSGSGSGGYGGASYSSSSPYESSSRSEHRDYPSGRDRDERRSDPYGGERSSGRHSPDRYSNKYRSDVSSKNQIFVRNIPFTLGTQQLRDYFRHSGHIVDCSIMMDKEGRSRGCGTVRFESANDCERAINMFHRSHLQGREIEVRLDI